MLVEAHTIGVLYLDSTRSALDLQSQRSLTVPCSRLCLENYGGLCLFGRLCLMSDAALLASEISRRSHSWPVLLHEMNGQQYGGAARSRSSAGRTQVLGEEPSVCRASRAERTA